MSDWTREEIVEEFRNAPVGDERLRIRLMKLAGTLAENPDKSFPQALNGSELEGAYRFLRNVKVRPEKVLQPHIRQTVARLLGQETVLVAHDSSTISFNSDGNREGLTYSRGEKQNFVTHCSLALRADGSRRPEGVLAASFYVRQTHRDGTLQERWNDHVQQVHQTGLAREQVVHLMDREADDYDSLEFLRKIGGRFVIRVSHNRRLDEGLLRDAAERAPIQAEREVPISSRRAKGGSKQRKIHPSRESRQAQLAISACGVEIKKSPQSKHSPRLQLHVVRVWEPHPPIDERPVEWLLYTTEPIGSAEQVLQVVDWYRARWTIEEYFKALKKGCSIERRQLGDFYSLKNAVALFLPIAWKLLLLKSEALVRPTSPATGVLASDELEVLCKSTTRPLPEQPTVSDVVLAIAALGGHLKHNGPPGWQILARGYTKLRNLVEGWNLRLSNENAS